MAACALGMPERVRAADYTPSLDWDPSPPDVVPIGSQYSLGVYTTNGFADLTWSVNWPGGDSSAVGNHNSTCSLGISGDTVGTHNLTVTLVSSNLLVVGTRSITQTVHVVAVTNITASTNHVAVGTNVLTFTAQMTPVAAGEHVFWNLPNGGGNLFTNQGLTTSLVCDTPGEFLVMAICGSSFVTTTIKVYAVTAVTGSPNPVAVGDTNLTLSVTVEPSGCPLPITWSVDGNPAAGTALTLTGCTALTVGKTEVKAALGSSAAWTNLWIVGVKRLEYENPQNNNWEDVSGASPERVGQKLTFRAIKDPEDAPSWPAGYPMWQSGSGAESGPAENAEALFLTVSQTVNDLMELKARCGTSSKTHSAIVFEMTLSNLPAEDWLGRSYLQFGLGETVGISNNIVPAGLTPATSGVTWTPENGGVVSGWDGVNGTVQGVTSAITKEFQLVKRGACFASSSMEFIAPTSINYVTKSGPTKPANSWFLSKEYRLHILPANVSFSAMEYFEAPTWLQGDGLVDLGRARLARFVTVKVPTDSKGSSVEPVKVELFRKLSDDAQTNGFDVGSQTATIPVGCRIKLGFDPDGIEVYVYYFLGECAYQAKYWGADPKSIQINWNADTFDGFYAPALPTASPP